MTRLNGRTALITGAGRGIGREIARRLAQEGAFVILHHGSSEQAARDLLEQIETEGGQGFLAGADLSDMAGIAGLFEAVDKGLARTGRGDGLDILVNNAGIGMPGDITTITPEAFDRVMAVDARAPLFVAQEAARRMGEGGRIINISSMVAHRAYQGFAIAYGAAKAALEYMTLSMAVTLGPRGITANMVIPGATDTDFIADVMQDPDMVGHLKSATALGGIGTPRDVADAVAFLASPEARWVTGTHINVSGGTLL